MFSSRFWTRTVCSLFELACSRFARTLVLGLFRSLKELACRRLVRVQSTFSLAPRARLSSLRGSDLLAPRARLSSPPFGSDLLAPRARLSFSRGPFGLVSPRLWARTSSPPFGSDLLAPRARLSSPPFGSDRPILLHCTLDSGCGSGSSGLSVIGLGQAIRRPDGCPRTHSVVPGI
jgi:hypothetical protein